MDDGLRAAINKLHDYCRTNDWAGYEPYDVMNSKVLEALGVFSSRLSRLVATQAFKRSAINLRTLVRVPKTQNPKALGLFLSAYLRLADVGVAAGEDCTGHIFDRLIALRSPGSPYWCWGYNFPWQTRTVLVPRWEPNLVCTCFAVDGVLDLYDRRHDPQCLAIAASAAEYLLKELHWTEGRFVCGFGYPLPSVRHQIHNANFLASALLCRVYSHTGERRYLDPAIQVARCSASRQNADGSWNYGQAPSQRWIDNFHTGFNLCALRAIGKYSGNAEFEPCVRRGLEFYRKNFFLKSGAVKYFHDRRYPIDAHCIAQSIITLLELKDLDPENVSLARSTYDWARAHLLGERGCFYYRRLRFCTVRTSYMRWTQAWMFLAMSMLLAESDAVREQNVRADGLEKAAAER